jgi:hypothetical protein
MRESDPLKVTANTSKHRTQRTEYTSFLKTKIKKERDIRKEKIRGTLTGNMRARNSKFSQR